MSTELKVVIVAGAAGGIGREISMQAAKAGAKVVLADLGCRTDGSGPDDEDRLAQVGGEVRALGGACLLLAGDVSDPAFARRIVDEAVENFGRLDALINCAGIIDFTRVQDLSDAAWQRMIDINLSGAYHLSKAAIDRFILQGAGGALVHLTSNAGLIGSRDTVHYPAAKAGIVGLSRSIALGLEALGIRSNCIAPMAWTRMLRSLPADMTGLGDPARAAKLMPEKIAPLALYLASPMARDVNGQIFSVRNDEISVMSQPRPICFVNNAEGWTVDTIAKHAIPRLSGSFTPLVSTDQVFPPISG